MLAYVEPFAPPVRVPRLAPTVYVRRRLVATLLLVVTLVAVAFLLVPRLASHGPDGVVTVEAGPRSASPAPTAGVGDVPTASSEAVSYVVQPGDTVWSIAEALDSDGDVRATVDRIVDANGGATLVVGQRLELTPSS